MLIRSSIFKTRKPKSFDFSPRYYDERKEHLEKLEKKFNADKALQGDPAIRARMKNEMDDRWSREHYSRQSGLARTRLLIIMTVLGSLLVYVYYQLDQFI